MGTKRIAILLVAVALAACGGGGGGNAPDPTPQAPPQERPPEPPQEERPPVPPPTGPESGTIDLIDINPPEPPQEPPPEPPQEPPPEPPQEPPPEPPQEPPQEPPPEPPQEPPPPPVRTTAYPPTTAVYVRPDGAAAIVADEEYQGLDAEGNRRNWALDVVKAADAYARLEARYGAGTLPGAGQRIAVIDTGIDLGLTGDPGLPPTPSSQRPTPRGVCRTP